MMTGMPCASAGSSSTGPSGVWFLPTDGSVITAPGFLSYSRRQIYFSDAFSTFRGISLTCSPLKGWAAKDLYSTINDRFFVLFEVFSAKGGRDCCSYSWSLIAPSAAAKFSFL